METPAEKIKRLQNLPLYDKIELSLILITKWYEAWDKDVYVSFSGGKDSTVLLNLARIVDPNIKAIFCNTGLEYPEILKFVRKCDNVTWVKPTKTFKEVIEHYGYPVVSKDVAQKLMEMRTTKSKKLYNKRLLGANDSYKSGKLPNKWHFLLYAPFKISEKCCNYLKKQPTKSLGASYIGNTYADSQLRQQQYLRNGGCGQFLSHKPPQSHPLYFWTKKDIWNYLKGFNISYSSIYDKGWATTGCMFCMFGVHLEKEPNRFQKMKILHPKHWEYCIKKLKLSLPLDYMEIPYN